MTKRVKGKWWWKRDARNYKTGQKIYTLTANLLVINVHVFQGHDKDNLKMFFKVYIEE